MTDRETKFWQLVHKRDPDQCWLWQGSRDRLGYGVLYHDSGKTRATHVALEIDGRARPNKKYFACHSCDNPPCVNPAHLWWGTAAENIQDSADKGRHREVKKTHCVRGHALLPGNLLPYPLSKGWRACRACKTIEQRERRARRRASR